MNDWPSDDWLSASAALQAEPAVLVTVAAVAGSGPREPGARMLVTGARQFDTIGGGHLELRAAEIARAMLSRDTTGTGADTETTCEVGHSDSSTRAEGKGESGRNAGRLERFALGPSLGQCCGGVVYLAFERIDAALAAVLAALRQRRHADCWRLSAIDGAAAALLFDAAGERIAGAAPASAPAFSCEPGTRLLRDGAGRRWLLDPCLAPRAHLTLFGAGHVGGAVVRALAELPCRITWVDERADLFPADVPANVAVEACEAPEALVDAAPAGASFLVMTHKHALDLRLAEAILARGDAGWFGLIGSLTKRRQFEHRLLARGFSAERIGAMVCPIGLAGIAGKAPAVIAASVCGQLLMAWEAAERARLVSCAPPLR